MLSAIYKIRNNLSTILRAEYDGQTVRGAEFRRLLQIVSEALPQDVDGDALEDSLQHLVGIPLTTQILADTAWRLAGNIQRLQDHRAVPPWHVQRFREWVPMQIHACRRGRNQRGNMGAFFSFRVVGGTPCPLSIYKWWSSAQCYFFCREMGFSRYSKTAKYPYSAPEQFVNLRLYGLIDPELSGREPMFHRVAFLPRLRKWNVEIIRRRFRVDEGYKCPKGYGPDFDCRHCDAGYQGALKCLGATHRADWERRPCEGCGHSDAFFDPDAGGKHCVDCQIANAYKRK